MQIEYKNYILQVSVSEMGIDIKKNLMSLIIKITKLTKLTYYSAMLLRETYSKKERETHNGPELFYLEFRSLNYVKRWT